MRPATPIALTQWLRRTHGWFGLWGATLGLLFGFSGIWLNHRAVLKLPFAQSKHSVQIALPEPAPATPEAMATWLREALQMPDGPNSTRIEPSRPVAWAERREGDERPAPLRQPERWVFNFGGPHTALQVEAWAGNRSVSVQRTDNGSIGTLTQLHKGIGMPVGWILLVDTLAGSLIFLSLSGLALWWLTHRRRPRASLIFVACATVAAAIAVPRVLAL